jgi:hypothetical protein
MLAQAIGYEGQARFIAFYWGSGDEAYYDDGRSSATGEWEAYLAFVQHPTIEPALRPYHLGDSDSEATHELVLDREERKLYVGTARAVNRFLQEQWPPLPTGEITQKEAMQSLLDSLNAENWEEVQTTINPDEIMRKMQEHQQMVQEMTTWLDGRARLD